MKKKGIKRFVIKTMGIIVIPILFCMCLYEISMRNIPNDYSYKNSLLEEKASRIKILILGSSHCYYGFDPRYFDKFAFNLAHVSQSYKYDAFLFNKYFDKMDSLEVVILPISSFSPDADLDSGVEYWRAKEYSIHYGCRYHKWWEYKYRYYFSNISINNLKQIFNRMLAHSYNNIHVDYNGYAEKTYDDMISDVKKDGKSAAIRHSINVNDMKHYHENMKYIENIIKKCQSKGIKVLFISTPTLPEYYTKLKSNQAEFMESYGIDLARNRNVRYINLLTSPLFNRTDFFNSDHLCNNGAKKLTLIINDTINEWNLRK